MLQSKRAIRWSGMAGGIGGVCVGMFTILVPYGTIAGAEVALSPLWRPAHSLHFVGGLLMLFGLLAIQAHQGSAAGGFGRFSFALALLAGCSTGPTARDVERLLGHMDDPPDRADD